MGIQQYAAPEGIDPKQFPHIDFSEESTRYKGPRYVMSRGGLADTNTNKFVFPKTPVIDVRLPQLDDLQEEIRERMSVVNGD